MAGEVRVGPQRAVASKSGMLVAPDVEIEVSAGRRYVSRGGQKLERALATFGVEVAGSPVPRRGRVDRRVHRLPAAGRRRAVVACVDVAYGELDWRLREDPRVTVLERTNARHLNPEQLPYAPELIVADVSFIGLAKVLPAVAACAATRFDLLALVKPQFEVGRDRVGKGGVVRDPSDRLEALVAAGARRRAGRDERPGVLLLGPSGAGRATGRASCGAPRPRGTEWTTWCAAAAEAEPEAVA